MRAPLLRVLAAFTSTFRKEKYDVFLSFRGSDTRTGFADFLYKRLLAAGVSVFRDEEALPFGEQIDKELHQAIRTCRIAIPIISPHFVESRTCNQELTEMIKCRRDYGRLVFPIFYKVNYVDVGCQRGKFGVDLLKHAMRYGPEEVLRWREALTSVARIRGWSSRSFAYGHEAELVEMVVTKVSSELKTMWLKQLPTFISSVYLYLLEKKSQWQVFLAFYGQNVQSTLASYLEVSLADVGIKVFNRDDPSLIGKDIAHEVRRAIVQSKICIPIISEKFGSSYSCLEELALMIESKEMNGQKVLPIFYNVKPWQLRHKSVLQRMDLRGRSSYQQCVRALRELGSYRGWILKSVANGNEGVFVKEIVKEVRRLLNEP